MASRTQVLGNIQKYAEKVRQTDYANVYGTEASQEARLEKTINELNARLEEERRALEELKAQADDVEIVDEYHEDVASQIRQLQVLTSAYNKVTPSEPQLPSANSALPALLALRSTQQLIAESVDSIRDTHVSLRAVRSRLAKEQADLRDAGLLKEALERRIETLREAAASKAQESSDEAARVLVDAEDARKQTYERDARQTMRSLLLFVNDTLSAMLAAEELGGPVAGSVLDVTDKMLVAGFNAQGKPKRSKAPMSDDKRQQRIDQIWGALADGEGEAQFDESSRNEAQAAADEMKTLIQQLLDALEEGGSGSWVTLNRESAAVRFLVRSGVALLHRTDAFRIRLVDFGRELDD